MDLIEEKDSSMIDKFTEQRIKDAARIEDVVSDFLELKRKGSNYETLCPFHNDRHLGSFVIYPRGNCYKCFSCDAKGGPVDFLIHYAHMTYPDALHYLAQKYGIHVDDEVRKFANVKPAKPRSIAEAIPADLPPRLWPSSWSDMYRDTSTDNLVRWMRALPWDGCERARLNEALDDYKVGHVSFNGAEGVRHDWTMFWEIDHLGQLHNGHMMKYKPNGKRDKDDPYPQTWLHARMRYATGSNHFDDRKSSASYCLFGQHLLDRYPNADVNIVESEKTALIMATAYGNHDGQVWMACCGMQNLNRERLGVLIEKGRKIVLFPDRDGIQKWTGLAAQLGYGRVYINTTVVGKCWKDCDGPKADIADVVLRIIHENRQPQHIGEVLREAIASNPALAKLNEKFGLKIE